MTCSIARGLFPKDSEPTDTPLANSTTCEAMLRQMPSIGWLITSLMYLTAASNFSTGGPGMASPPISPSAPPSTKASPA